MNKLETLPNSTLACMPIIPLVMLFNWSWLLPGSYLSLIPGGTILIKSLFFSFSVLDKRISWLTGLGTMLLANIVSTIIGFIVILPAASPGIALIFLPIIYLISIPPARRLHELSSEASWQLPNPLVIAGIITLLFLSNFIIFFTVSGSIIENKAVGIGYWIGKLIYIYCGLAVSFFLTAVWEETVIAAILKRSLISTVFKINLYTMLVVFLGTAIVIIPERLNSPNFLLRL